MSNNNEDIDINNDEEEMINDMYEGENENENLENFDNDNINKEFYQTNNFEYSQGQGQNIPLNFDYKSRTTPDFSKFNESNQNKNFSQSDINFENNN